MKNLPRFKENDFKTSSLCWTFTVHCVAVAYKEGTVAVRDTKNPNQAALHFNKEEWRKFVAGVKNGEFDFD